jgi:hypothetical protein
MKKTCLKSKVDLITGDEGRLRPDGFATREQIAAVIMRFAQMIK